MSPPVPPAGTMPRKSRRRLPDQPFSPPPCTGALDLPPDEGRASPHFRRGPAPPDTLGSSPLVARSFSPARLNAVGAGVPAFCGHAEPACTTWSEKTRVTGAQDRATRRPSRRAELRHALNDVPGDRQSHATRHASATRSNNPRPRPSPAPTTETFTHRLTTSPYAGVRVPPRHFEASTIGPLTCCLAQQDLRQGPTDSPAFTPLTPAALGPL